MYKYRGRLAFVYAYSLILARPRARPRANELMTEERTTAAAMRQLKQSCRSRITLCRRDDGGLVYFGRPRFVHHRTSVSAEFP